MLVNKYNLARRLSYRVVERFPKLVRLKRPLMYFRLRRLAKRLDVRREAHRASMAANSHPPLFEAIEIETINRCNGECGFCPVNRHLDPRPAVRMSEELFFSIIRQLRELDYRREVYLYSNNEPLLDVRLEAFARHAKEQLPGARIYLSTNGSLLTPEKYRAIMPWIDAFTINNYCDDFAWRPEIVAIKEIAENNAEWWAKTEFVMRYRREVKTSRGGQAPNKQVALPATLPVGCYYPAKQMIVRPDGKLSLCCNDALGTASLGDLTGQSITEAWYSQLRVQTIEAVMAGRDAFPVCRHCDTLSH